MRVGRAPSPMTIAVIAPLRHPLGEPHAGGLEAAVYQRIRLLRARGHRVLVCAIAGSTPAPHPRELTLPAPRWAPYESPTDATYPAGYLDEATAELGRALAWLDDHADSIDVIDNHSLHPLPLEHAREDSIPQVTTLHTPPFPEMVDAALRTTSRLVAVSSWTAAEWESAGVTGVDVLHNTIDESTWRLGRGGGDLVWFGRVVPEKAPHLAIAAARSVGRSLTIAGRIGDEPYFRRVIQPLLAADVQYVGELMAADLARLVGASSATLVTPDWDEPFGLVLAEALATGTPVAAFARGGLLEVAGSNPGVRFVAPGDVLALGRAADDLVRADSMPARHVVRADAVRRFSHRSKAIDIERLFDEVVRDSQNERLDGVGA